MTRTHRVGRWAGRRIGRRLEKSIPLVGTLFALAFLADAVRRKGMMRGLADTALNALPLFGTLKNGIEIFTDDWIPDRPPAASSASSAASPRRSTPGRRTRGE
jgi:hypothetical protein